MRQKDLSYGYLFVKKDKPSLYNRTTPIERENYAAIELKFVFTSKITISNYEPNLIINLTLLSAAIVYFSKINSLIQ